MGWEVQALLLISLGNVGSQLLCVDWEAKSFSQKSVVFGPWFLKTQISVWMCLQEFSAGVVGISKKSKFFLKLITGESVLSPGQQNPLGP